MRQQIINKKAVIDISIVLVVLFSLKTILLTSDTLWTYAGPIALLLTLGVATWRLSLSKLTWPKLGLNKNISKKQFALWTLLALIISIVVGELTKVLVEGIYQYFEIVMPVINERNAGRFADVPGNFSLYAFWLCVAWIIGGFTEELLFRAYLLNRIETAFPKLPGVLIFAILLQAIIFGQQHYYYQGIAGFASNTLMAIVMGVLYIVFKRNLWPLVFAHGIANTIGLTMLYMS